MAEPFAPPIRCGIYGSAQSDGGNLFYKGLGKSILPGFSVKC